MHHLVYITIHRPSGKYYWGRHVTDNINDGYSGSGVHTLLNDKSHLETYIVHDFKSADKMFAKEEEYIEDDISDPLCMNIAIGDGSHTLQHHDKTKHKISNTRIKFGIARGKNNPMFGKRGKISPNYGKPRKDVAERNKTIHLKRNDLTLRNLINNPASTQMSCVKCGHRTSKPTLIRDHGRNGEYCETFH